VRIRSTSPESDSLFKVSTMRDFSSGSIS
jgi:hypothetical protein